VPGRVVGQQGKRSGLPGPVTGRAKLEQNRRDVPVISHGGLRRGGQANGNPQREGYQVRRTIAPLLAKAPVTVAAPTYSGSARMRRCLANSKSILPVGPLTVPNCRLFS